LEEFNIARLRKTPSIALSGGERRRVEIARALAIDPKFILLDEPFAGVDPIAVEDIQHIIARLKTKNIGIIITDHNVHETLAITDRAYLLYEGSILESGSAEDLAGNPEVRRKYLGQNFELRKSILPGASPPPAPPAKPETPTPTPPAPTQLDLFPAPNYDLQALEKERGEM
ncbi:MAG: ATP-binding cassette domain-containing protein, partial [Bacteroidales bacterium]|nr:ATP-binding cassette domain-containing protein [Bacteroidales bacterium]